MQLYPDMGVAAMLRNEWKDCSFGIAALNERGALTEEDEVLILAAADPQGADPLCYGGMKAFFGVSDILLAGI